MSLSRRQFTQATLGSLLTYSLLETLITKDAFSAEMKLTAPKGAITPLIVRTTRFPGGIGARRIRYSNSRAGLFSCPKSIRCSRKWFQGRPIHGTKVTDIGWFTRAVLSGAFVLRS